MENYQKFKEELSVYENKSKTRVNIAIFIHKFFRAFTTKTFDFIVSLAIFVVVPMFFVGFDLTVFTVSVIGHFVYWLVIYSTLAKRFESNINAEFNLRIRILEEIKSRK
jgi:hypothetical protein